MKMPRKLQLQTEQHKNQVPKLETELDEWWAGVTDYRSWAGEGDGGRGVGGGGRGGVRGVGCWVKAKRVRVGVVGGGGGH